MSIYKGLLLLGCFRVAVEDADDLAAPAAPAPHHALAATSCWRRTLLGIGAFAGVLPVNGPPDR